MGWSVVRKWRVELEMMGWDWKALLNSCDAPIRLWIPEIHPGSAILRE